MQLTIPDTIPIAALARFAAEQGFTLKANPAATMLTMVPMRKEPSAGAAKAPRGAESWAPGQ